MTKHHKTKAKTKAEAKANAKANTKAKTKKIKMQANPKLEQMSQHKPKP